MAGHRTDKLSEELKKQISTIIRDELKDPDIPMMCSVLYVEVTRDLRHAKVNVSIMGDEDTQTKAFKALVRSQGYVRHLLAKAMTVRYIPEITFELDQSISHSIRVSQLINEMKRSGNEEQQKYDQ